MDYDALCQNKSNLLSPVFMELDVQNRIRGRRGRLDTLALKPLYTSRLPISLAKKNDLGRLVLSRVIPPEYAQWYNELPAASHVRDNLAEPTADEPEVDD